MKKMCYMAVAAAALLFGCESPQADSDDYKPLSEKEMTYMENYVTYNVRRDSRLTQEQSDMMKDIRPVVKIHYDGDKEGKAYLYWNIPQTEAYARQVAEDANAIVPYKTINVRGYGDLSDPASVMWQVSVVNQGDIIITPAAERLMKEQEGKKPEKAITPERWNDIINR